MADWSSQNITLTAKGASALSKVQAGSGSLTITRVVASEQYVAESTLREVTSLSVENLPLTIIDRHEVQDGGSVIQVQLSNLYLGKAFTLNEIGVFATHSDNPSEEFLYIIAQVDEETGDKIPLYATTPVTATYDIYLYNVGADNVQITISSAGLVTYEALNKACDIIQRNTAYEVGDILHSHSLKKGLAIKCTVAGITKSTDTDLSHKNVGDTVEDGTSQWVVIAPSTTADFDAHNHSVDAHPELMKQLIESGLNVIKRSHSYAKGDIAYSDKIPSWAFLECIVAGTTSDGWYFPEPSEIKVGDTIVDYTVTWKVRKVADTASKLATARNIALTGKAAGSTTFDGSANASINVTSVNADTATNATHASSADSATNADKVDGYHEKSFLRYRGSAAATGKDTLWNQIGIKQYDNVLPESLTCTFLYGAVVSFPSPDDRLDLWYDCYASDNGVGLYYRTGWQNDKHKWARLLDSNNYINWAPTKTGRGASGTWGISISGNAKTATTASSVAWSGVTGKPGTYPPSAHNHDSAYPSVTGARASGTWGISISGNADSATNADKVDGYHASDLLSKIQGVLPKTAAEVGQFRELVVNNSHQIKLPDGGTWAYFVYTYNSWSGDDSNNEHRTRTGAGIAAGGTVLHTDDSITSNTINAFKLSGTAGANGADGNNIIVGGFCWRIA